MILFRVHKNMLKSIIILILFVIIMNLTTFYLSETVISNSNLSSNTSETSVHLPTSFHYIWLQSATAFLPEEDTLIILKSFNQYTGCVPSSLYNDFNTVTPLIRAKLPTSLLLASFKRTPNANTTNAIPLGGHAPPCNVYLT